MKLSPTAAAIGLLVLLAAAPRLYNLDWSLPHSYEEATPLRVAWQMWGWDEGTNITLNPGFFNYPSLTFYLHFIVQGALYVGMNATSQIEGLSDWQVMRLTDPAPLFLSARLVNVLLALVTVLAVFRTARIVAGSLAAFFALVVAAMNPFHIARSQMVDVDVPLTCFSAIALLFAAGIVVSGRRGDYIRFGVAAGLATSSKYTGILLLVPLAAAHLLRTASQGQGKAPLRRLVLAIAFALASFVLTSPYTIIDLDTFVTAVRAEQHHLELGHFGVDDRPAWRFYASSLAGGTVSIPVLVAALVGAGHLIVRRRSRPAIVIAAFLAAHLAVISLWEMKADRYILPALPPIAVFAGAGLSLAWHRLKGHMTPRRAGVVAAVVVILTLTPDLIKYLRHVEDYRRDTRTDVVEWLERHVAPGSYIVTEPYGPELLGPPVLMTFDPGLRAKVLGRLQGRGPFAVQNIPMFQTSPERSAAFYSLDLYPNADYIIVSSGVQSRYRRQPDLFAPQLAFYRDVEQRWEKAREFAPPKRGGVTINVYRRPLLDAPFASRTIVSPPPLLPSHATNVGDSDARFYFEAGANYEFFRHVSEASQCYVTALERGADDARLFHNCVLGVTRCLLALGRGHDAIGFLRSVAAGVTDPTMRTTLTGMADQLSESLKQSAR